ncbi:MAG TPA: NADH:flavin oxidoreductase [Anaerolineae bacterium]|jgi:2,4-dienoyl-CoA reductase-like NADH-dependent reductase (Old Yellow Enzyme family)|nr:NADH:flavin oxidoreductase [Anaerolineae bacterium]
MPGLFDPIDIDGVRLKNRIVMPPMESGKGTPEGNVTQAVIDHYVKRAQGGVGFIIVEHTYVMPNGRLSLRQLGLYEDRQIEGFKRLVDSIHAVGVPCALQLNHAGLRTTVDVIGEQPVSASDIPYPAGAAAPRSLFKEEIMAIVDAFARAAVRAKEAGFDGVEIHGAHGFLLNQFASPLTNRRNDEYGIDLAGRMRFPTEVIQAVRESVGSDYLLLYRLGADDLIEGGITIDEGVEMAKLIVNAGIKVVDVSGGLGGSRPVGMKPGHFVPQASMVRQAVDVPVIAVGLITTGELADDIIRDGEADLVAIGRALLKNPTWPKTVATDLGLE